MNPEPNTLAEYRVANDKLKADFVELKREFESYKADAEEIIRRLKAKQRQPEDPPRPGITRIDFGG